MDNYNNNILILSISLTCYSLQLYPHYLLAAMATTASVSKGPEDIIREGMVIKQGGRIKTWKHRWCVLDKKGVGYYKPTNEVRT